MVEAEKRLGARLGRGRAVLEGAKGLGGRLGGWVAKPRPGRPGKPGGIGGGLLGCPSTAA